MKSLAVTLSICYTFFMNGRFINDVNAFCNITDFSPLASLSNLKSLTIKNNSFTEDPSNINLGNDVEIIQ